MMVGNYMCPKCGRDYIEKPALCKCLEPGYNFVPIKKYNRLKVHPYHRGA